MGVPDEHPAAAANDANDADDANDAGSFTAGPVSYICSASSRTISRRTWSVDGQRGNVVLLALVNFFLDSYFVV